MRSGVKSAVTPLPFVIHADALRLLTTGLDHCAVALNKALVNAVKTRWPNVTRTTAMGPLGTSITTVNWARQV